MRQYKRSQRLSVQILRDISELLEPELPGVVPGLVTFTKVKLSDDLRYAKVYFSYLGEEANKERVTDYLNREKKRIRTDVGRKLRVRHIPEIEFRFDPSIEEGIRIEQLLNEIKGEGNKDK
jgi:ribosome-binding factor A